MWPLEGAEIYIGASGKENSCQEREGKGNSKLCWSGSCAAASLGFQLDFIPRVFCYHLVLLDLTPFCTYLRDLNSGLFMGHLFYVKSS